MDAFQGCEKWVILLSTVRSTTRGPRPDSFLGFLADPKVSNPPLSTRLPPLSIQSRPRCLGVAPVFMMLSSCFSPEVQRGHDARPRPADRGGELRGADQGQHLEEVRGREIPQIPGALWRIPSGGCRSVQSASPVWHGSRFLCWGKMVCLVTRTDKLRRRGDKIVGTRASDLFSKVTKAILGY